MMTWSPRRMAAICGGLGALLASHGAMAQVALCSGSITPVAFGDVNPTLGGNTDAMGTLTVSCTGIGLLSGTATVCVGVDPGTGGGGPATSRTMKAGAAALTFGLYKDGGYSQPLGGAWSSVNDILPVTVTIPLLGSTTVTRPVYGRVPSQPGAAVGNYLSTLTVSTTNGLLNLGGNCTGLLTWAGTSRFNATARVQNTCKLAVKDLDFGAQGVLSGSLDRATTIDATCTAGTPYTIAIGQGLSGTTDPARRRMSKGAEGVTYGLYRDSGRSLPWGWTAGSNADAGIGAGSRQSIPVYGRAPAQATPSPGVYTDTVVVTLTY